MAESLLESVRGVCRYAEFIGAGVDSILELALQALAAGRGARAIRADGDDAFADAVLVRGANVLNERLALVCQDLPMIHRDCRRISAEDPRLFDTAASMVEFVRQMAAPRRAMAATARDASAAEECARAIRAAGYAAFADEVLRRAQVILDEGMEVIHRGLPTLRYDGRRIAEPSRPPIRCANAAAAQNHRSRSRSRR